MAKEHKTNVMRILDKEKVPYQLYFYSHEDGLIDGVSVVHRLDQPAGQVFKTLMARGASKSFYVLVIPAEQELDLKAATQSASEKSVEMIRVSGINQITGYIRDGCSPIDMRKQFRTMINEFYLQPPIIIVSGGKIGTQVELLSLDLISLIGASTAQLCK